MMSRPPISPRYTYHLFRRRSFSVCPPAPTPLWLSSLLFLPSLAVNAWRCSALTYFYAARYLEVFTALPLPFVTVLVRSKELCWFRKRPKINQHHLKKLEQATFIRCCVIRVSCYFRQHVAACAAPSCIGVHLFGTALLARFETDRSTKQCARPYLLRGCPASKRDSSGSTAYLFRG